MADLRLPRLPDRTPVRITIIVDPELNQALSDYAAAYAESYGAGKPVAELIPAMLAAFITSDRAFGRRQRSGAS
jgi:hypothetical protein